MSDRIDSEWIALNAFRAMLQLASKGDPSISTYANAFQFGANLYPELLGPESVLQPYFDSPTVKEYKQRAKFEAKDKADPPTALSLLCKDIEHFKTLHASAKEQNAPKPEYDKIAKRLKTLLEAKSDIERSFHYEGDLIFRDGYIMGNIIPSPSCGNKYKDFSLPDGNLLRVRVFHPDKPEHISGADLFYERHDPKAQTASIAAVQYKIWSDELLNISEHRLHSQLNRMQSFLCTNGFCNGDTMDDYRFPYCSAFLRPTDRLQNPSQRFMSTGHHIPICKLEQCSMPSGASAYITGDSIKHCSVTGEIFQNLFNTGKIGSREIPYVMLEKLHESPNIDSETDNLRLHLQEITL